MEGHREKEFFIDNILVRVHFIIVMIRWTGLASWECKFPFPGSLTSTFLVSGNEIYYTQALILLVRRICVVVFR